MPIDFALFGEMLDQTYKIWEEYLRDYSNAPVDYVNFSVSEDSIRIGVNVGAEDRANYPLEKILAVTAQVEAYWHEASSYKTYEKHLQTLKTDPENPIAEHVLAVEGEKKAIVTCATLDVGGGKASVVGFPGKNPSLWPPGGSKSNRPFSYESEPR